MRQFLRLCTILVQIVWLRQAASYGALYCNQRSAEPTIFEVLESAIPLNINSGILSDLEVDGYYNCGLSLLNNSIPIRTFFANGLYKVKFWDEGYELDYTFSDVYIIQEKFTAFNIPCSLLSSTNSSLFKFFCDCPKHTSSISNGGSKLINLESNPEMSEWCIQKAPCTDKNYQSGECVFTLDPFRRSCLLIDSENIDFSGLNDARQYLQYSLQIPNLKDMLYSNSLIRKLLLAFDPSNSFLELVEGINGAMEVLSFIPSYLLSFAIGWYIVLYAAELAEWSWCQRAVEAFYGFFFALIVLVFVLYRLHSDQQSHQTHSIYTLYTLYVHSTCMLNDFTFLD